jgi:hypothetical protein
MIMIIRCLLKVVIDEIAARGTQHNVNNSFVVNIIIIIIIMIVVVVADLPWENSGACRGHPYNGS